MTDGLAPGDSGAGCSALDLAASGLLDLTGPPDRPVLPTAPVLGHLRGLDRALRALGAGDYRDPCEHPVEVLVGRAADRGFTRRGSTSANGTARLIRGADGWLAMNLARPSDVELLPALVHRAAAVDPDDAWPAIEEAAIRRPAGPFVERAQSLGIPAAVVPDPGRAPVAEAVTSIRIGDTAPGPKAPVVVDFSAMWAGPLAAFVLGRAGMTVTKVEDPARPDGMRVGDPGLYARLHDGHARALVDFGSSVGRRELRELLAEADVVIEGSRPRALAGLGLLPGDFLSGRAGRVWLSITGYGRSAPHANWSGFGDDTAAAGGLVAWTDPGSGAPASAPVFCGDALADPLTGLVAAVSVLAARAAGGGRLVAVSMAAVASHVARGPRCPRSHLLHRDGSRWGIGHRDGEVRPVLSPAEVLGRAA